MERNIINHYFRILLGEISVEELIDNHELIKSAESLNSFLIETTK